MYGSIWQRSLIHVSPFWRESVNIALKYKAKLTYKIGIASSFSLVFDLWFKGYTIRDLFGPSCFDIFNDDPNSPLHTIMSHNGWNLNAEFISLYPEMASVISSLSIYSDGDDIL